jgi:hypothetical protein
MRGKNILAHQKVNHHPNCFPRAKVSNFFGAKVLVISHTKKQVSTPKKKLAPKKFWCDDPLFDVRKYPHAHAHHW